MNRLSHLNSFLGIYHFSSEQVLSKFTPLQKKLGLVALAAFIGIGAIYSLWCCSKRIQFFYNQKDPALAKVIVKPPTLLQPVSSQLKPMDDVFQDAFLAELEEQIANEEKIQLKESQTISTKNATQLVSKPLIKAPIVLTPVASLPQISPPSKNAASIELQEKPVIKSLNAEKLKINNLQDVVQLTDKNATQLVSKPLIEPPIVLTPVASLPQISLPSKNAASIELQEIPVIKSLDAEKLKINNLQDVVQLAEKHPNGCSANMLKDIKQLTTSDICFISDQIEILDNYFKSELVNRPHSFITKEVIEGIFTFNRLDLYNFYYTIRGRNLVDRSGMTGHVTSCYEDAKGQQIQFSIRLDRFQHIIDSYLLLHMQDVILGICEARSSATFVYGHQKGMISSDKWATPCSSVLTTNGEYPINSTVWTINDSGRCVPEHALKS